ASVAKEKLVEPSSFCFSSSSADRTDPTTGGFSDLTGSDFLVGAIPSSTLILIFRKLTFLNGA
ncbi:hypothetical protein Tco_0589612, partial [Tanacetum coccineum]